MPEIILDQGETDNIYTAESPGDKVFLRVTSGSARFAREKRHARAGRFLATDDKGEVMATHEGEELWLHGEEDGTTIEYERQGWALDVFGREIFRLNASDTVGQMPTTIDGQNVTLDQQITGQTVDVEMDIVRQSLGELSGDTVRISAEGVVEVNADQTQNVNDGETVTTTVTADAGQVWTLRRMRLHAPAVSGASGQHSFTVQTEKEGIQAAYGDALPDADLTFDTGEWISADSGRLNIEDLRIDDTNGLDIEYAYSDSNSNTQTGDRQIRLAFEVVDV